MPFELNHKKWEEMYNKLQVYYHENGHSKVPSSYRKDPQLAKWVVRQREGEDKMPKDRKIKLDQLQFYWRKDLHKGKEDDWFNMFEKLKTFFNKHGHTKVSKRHKQFPKLYYWVEWQRDNKEKLQEDKTALLNTLNFNWRGNAQKEHNRNWEKMFKALKAFYEKNGHSRVPYRYESDRSLGRWVLNQRLNEYKLGAVRKKKLDSIQFCWQVDFRKEKNKNWLLMFKKLEKYKKDNGDCNVPSLYKLDKKLGRWVERQRSLKNDLQDWKREKLEELDFSWSEDIQVKKTKRWYDMFERLRLFYEKFGHSRVPEYWEDDKELSMWVISQRRPKRPLSKDRMELLKSVDFAWNNESYNRKRDMQGRYQREV